MTDKPNIVILTGAGISRESGISTFRDADGVWAKVRIEDVATPQAFAKNPHRVHEFYNDRRTGLAAGDIEPNAAHLALAKLEKNWPGDFLLVTQNVDDLHDRAGSKKLIHMHGELFKARCNHCEIVRDWRDSMNTQTVCPSCEKAGGMRPHIVWFGEMPMQMELIMSKLAQCGLFMSIGTSGQVYPAAGFAAEASRVGAHTVELNLEATGGAFAEAQHGPATELVPAYVEQLLGE
jgi:NAD-dependent deacetylase